MHSIDDAAGGVRLRHPSGRGRGAGIGARRKRWRTDGTPQHKWRTENAPQHKNHACAHNASLISEQLAALPRYFLRHWADRSVTFDKAQRTYQSLAGWGRTRFQILEGQLYYPDLKHNTFGCVLRRTPILAWALLETLERFPHLPDVDIAVNCRDKPGSQLRDSPPALAFSYTTGVAYSDIPLPDYTYWGLPYADLPPWEAWLSSTMHSSSAAQAAPAHPFQWTTQNAAEPAFRGQWAEKLDRMIWVGSPTNPLRSSFEACARDVFGARLEHRMPDKEAMHDLAWRCAPSATGVPCGSKPRGWTPLSEQCRYRYILHLPGISDWLEHFKHQLACGAVNIFIGHRPRSVSGVSGRSAFGLCPPLSFEHFDFTGPLLREGEQYLYVSADAHSVCTNLRATIEMLDQAPRRAECIARRGQQLAASLNMESVYAYLAGVLSEASLRQRPGVARRVVAAEGSRMVTKRNYFSFVPPAKRPWMEYIFRVWHSDRFNSTPLLPPRTTEFGSGMFH